jgi:hypothetical protein
MPLSLALVLTPVLFVFMVFAFVVPILLRLFRGCRREEITAEWLENFSATAYAPMAGLLAEDDFEFLSKEPGFDLSLYRKLRRDRLRIFRQYLNRLIADFNRLHTCTRLAISQTKEDHSDVLLRLVVLRLSFSVTVLRVEASYLLCRFGFRPLDIGSLILRLEEMSGQFSRVSQWQPQTSR